MASQRPRVFILDFIRALSIALVCMGHAVEQTFHFAENDVLTVQGVGKGLLVLILFSLARISVPFFLFLTGYFFLPRTYDGPALKDFWVHKFLRLLLCTELWIILYNIFDHFFWKELDITVLSVVREMLFLENVPTMDHYWYLPMILGIYLFLPIIANGLKHIQAKWIAFPVLFILLAFMLLPGLGSVAVTILDDGFDGGIFGVYVLLGYMVHENVFRRIPGWLLGAVAAVSFALIHVTEFMTHQEGKLRIVWYSWLPLFLTAACLFELLCRHCKRPEVPTGFGRAINFVSRYSFAIYLTHFPLTLLSVRIMYWYTSSAFLTFIVATVVPFFGGLFLSWLLDRIPKVGRYLLYMR